MLVSNGDAVKNVLRDLSTGDDVETLLFDSESLNLGVHYFMFVNYVRLALNVKGFTNRMNFTEKQWWAMMNTDVDGGGQQKKRSAPDVDTVTEASSQTQQTPQAPRKKRRTWPAKVMLYRMVNSLNESTQTYLTAQDVRDSIGDLEGYEMKTEIHDMIDFQSLALMVGRNLFSKAMHYLITNECEGCHIEAPSQRDHDCMMNPDVSMIDYYDQLKAMVPLEKYMDALEFCLKALRLPMNIKEGRRLYESEDLRLIMSLDYEPKDDLFDRALTALLSKK